MDDDRANEAFGGKTMREVYLQVMDAQQVFPMKKPKLKGLAKLLDPERADAPPEYDHSYPWGLQPFDFEPDKLDDDRVGLYRYSAVDRLLATHEEEAELCLKPLGPLSTVDEWFDAMMLPPNARIRRNPRFVRALEVLCCNVKYTPKEKYTFLDSFKWGMQADPSAAGYTDGVLPFEQPEHMPTYDESEMDPWVQHGVKGVPKAELRLPTNRLYVQKD